MFHVFRYQCDSTRRCDRDSVTFCDCGKAGSPSPFAHRREIYMPISKVPIFSSPLFSWFDRTNDEITTGYRSRRWHNARSSKLSTNGWGKLLACIDVDLFPFRWEKKNALSSLNEITRIFDNLLFIIKNRMFYFSIIFIVFL